jgi:hypothetical protein
MRIRIAQRAAQNISKYSRPAKVVGGHQHCRGDQRGAHVDRVSVAKMIDDFLPRLREAAASVQSMLV